MSVIAAEDTTDIMVSDANQTFTTENSSILEETESIEATQDSVVDDKDNVSSNIATTYTISSYSELVSTIADIKENGISTENYTINLDNTADASDYLVTETITWGDTDQVALNLTINGNGVTINGTNTTQFMTVSSGYSLTLAKITITDCTAEDGEAIYSSNGYVNITNSSFTNNTGFYDGAININGSYVNITNSNFTNNRAGWNGGVIYSSNSNVNITNSSFTKNTVGGHGIVYLSNYYGMTVNIINSSFTNNTSTDDGGAIYIYATSNRVIITLYGLNFTNNTASNGGVIYIYIPCTLNVYNTTFTSNTASNNGGVIYAKGSINITVNNTNFINNTINTGSVVFKLNGKTITTVEVTNGVATYNYTITNNPKDYNITAKYTENTIYTDSEVNSTLTVNSRQATITISQLQEDIIVQDTITISVTVTEDSGVVNGGIVIFKINGKTLMNEDGRVLNATVINGTATITYTIPTSFSTRNYTLNVMYSGKNYERVEEITTFTITKSDVQTDINPLTTTKGQNTTITITLYNENGNQIQRDTKVAIKINGKTYITTNTTNGILNVELPTDTLSTGYYNITVILGENTQYNTLRIETILTITQTTESKNSTLTQKV